MCYLFVFRHKNDVRVGFIVLTDQEEKAWKEIAKMFPVFGETLEDIEQKTMESAKLCFDIIAKLEVPGLSRK